MSVIVVNHLSLDGVVQGPGRADEDTRGDFRHGGWAASSDDPAIGRAMGTAMGSDFSWLFGHRTYDDLLGHWNAVGGPFRDGLNGVTKYVASTDPDAAVPWPNSTLLTGDVPAAVARLRDELDGNLVVMGSGALVRSLLPLGLVDELLLVLHPVVLGGGTRLFPDDRALHRFTLLSAEATSDGLVLARYRRDIE